MFNPGETVSHTFIIPFVKSELSKVIITYKQANRIVLTKTITSGFEAQPSAKSKVVITFSQQETLLFEENMPYKIQVNVYTKEGARAASCEINGSSGVQHYKEVITNG